MSGNQGSLWYKQRWTAETNVHTRVGARIRLNKGFSKTAECKRIYEMGDSSSFRLSMKASVFQIGFQGIKGDYRSDMAIDDIKILQGPCTQSKSRF